MSLINFLKKKPAKIVAEKKPKESKVEKPHKAEISESKKKRRISQSYLILKTPHVTEKASDLAEKNQYSFRVFSKANKAEIKKAVESDFGVDVVSVRIINVHRKKRRLGKIKGIKPGYKKAIVKIKKGQKIEILPR